jgi:hypothetical protein
MIKLNSYLLVLFIFLFHSLKACDICGCSAGGMNGGLFPQIQNNMLGIRYGGLIYSHPLAVPNLNGNSQLKRDIYHDSEVFLRWYPARKWQFWVNIPYNIRIREESLRTTTIQGVGDLRFSAFYELIRRDSSIFKFKHLFMAGAGCSLPTGKYQQRDETLAILPVGFQTGTGSWSASLRMIYMLRFNKYGLITQSGYRTFSENERQFKKGDISDGGISLFRSFTVSAKTNLYFHAGYKLELLNEDIEYNSRKFDSGSLSGWMNVSADLISGPFLLSLNADFPAISAYNGNQPLPGKRLSASIAFVW